jgi:cytosine/adenosine deaminase-related metal-dependent hydrolase
MSTIDGADVVGLAPIGTIAVGQRADISVFGRTSSDPYQAVIDSRARDVRLVLIDGLGYYGDAALQAATAVNTSCESFDACGTPKSCVLRTRPAR